MYSTVSNSCAELRNVPTPGEDKAAELTVVSFFSGCGGLDLGFRGGFTYRDSYIPRSDYEFLGAYDNDTKCVETYNQNVGNHASVKDLSSFDPAMVPRADLLIGGFPCQEFASCGPRRGLESPRGQLYKALIKYMQQHRPRLVVGENVPGLLTMDGGQAIAKIQEELEGVGYKVALWNLYAPNYGVPQRRSRVFIIAVREDLPGLPIEPVATHESSEYRTAGWAISDLEAILDESIPNQSQYFRASRAKNGNGQGDETTAKDSPSYTVRANPKSRVQFHYSLDRRLTVRECARLQTFPDDFTFGHSATTNIMQIGNAVPPLLAHHVANAVRVYLKELR